MITEQQLQDMHRYWQAANYLSAGQIYLQDNPLLREPLKPDHIKPRLLGHWGTSPGLSFIYVHLNRLIKETGSDVLYICGPGHGAPAIVANAYLEGSYSEIYPHVPMDEKGIKQLFRQFSTPGGIPSHVSAHTPGSIHEGGELGYSLVHAFGAAFDNPDLIVACVVGDGEAETAPLEGSWKSLSFLNPVRDGAVLPILHLNGYKIAGPTVLARKTNAELTALFSGYGYEVFFVEGSNPMVMHRNMIEILDNVYARIRSLQQRSRTGNEPVVNGWPMIIMRTPKGWTGPKEWEHQPIENSFRSHQVPLTAVKTNPEQLRLVEDWMRSYAPEKLFDKNGRLMPELQSLAPSGNKRMGMLAVANGGTVLKELQLPDFKQYAVNVPHPGTREAESTRNFGNYLRDIFELNKDHHNFRLFCPDETASNRLQAVFEKTARCFLEARMTTDDHLSPEGRVMEVLSEHLCEGWLEGYLLTGRHGLFSCYEAFITIIDSMFSQYAKWIKTSRELPWRKPVASLNYLLTSHSWRQDHNGYSHQGPGFIDTVINKKSSVTRIYFPPDANTLLSVMHHCFSSKDYANLVVAGKQPELQWLTLEEAITHCARGASVWKWAGNDEGAQPDVVIACAGDVPTLEAVAAVAVLREQLPDLKVRLVNIVDLMALSPILYHPHGLGEDAFTELFTNEAPVIFAFHGYVRIIHDLVHGRPNPERFHVRGYMEEGTTTTPFDMTVLNNMSRYQLAMEAVKRVPRMVQMRDRLNTYCEEKLKEHRSYICTYFDDLPEIKNWKWTY
ncbi:phosphoketolase family protein [Niabella drilacis]|uniref:Xylulose-5-phosphate/fructose-6-phosphate phosphoketolase n=1 Tax=Niabella drilacis (strain DSM 25811 / CCM 8410 / CCUG 62505 / LMG 26954 / E90) TaxID=1285928 RepID=A0A1G7A6A3_NIADE|nr:phosphoketolase family protein [Niabella drilacis]SDE10342.1 xylulose-5-phosphate/fructose-6-phosphate phosphoketolase [Niabella drilacis]